jgi:plastocyanin
MFRRRKALTIGLAYWVMVLLWGPLSLARAADGLSPSSEQPPRSTYQEPVVPKYRPPMQGRSFRDPAPKPTYQKPVVPKYRPPTQQRSFTDPAPKSLPHPSGEAMPGTADIGQTGKVVAPSQRVAPVVDPIKTGSPTIVGRVQFRGVVPPATHLDIDRDVEICGKVVNLQPITIDPTTGGLHNAVVHVDVGMAAVATEVSNEGQEEVVPIRNKNCTFVPQMGVGRTGSEAEITNGDPLMHNTNMTFVNRTILNVALVQGGNPIRKSFKKAGLHLVKCNVHKFMYGYRYVFDDPFFAMTNETGQFRISNLPPGLHLVTVWHETLGIVQKEVQVPSQGIVNLDFEFK